MDTLHQIDYAIFHFINHQLHSSFLNILLPFLRNAFNWIPLYVLVALFLFYKYKAEAIVYILYIALAFALADVISASILKPFFARLRPCHSSTLDAILVIGHCGGKWSFPSSHASNHMAIALSIVLASFFQQKWINAIWIIWALSIGFAQIYIGVHYPSDIVAGFILGIAIAFFNYKICLPLLKKSYAYLLVYYKHNS